MFMNANVENVVEIIHGNFGIFMHADVSCMKVRFHGECYRRNVCVLVDFMENTQVARHRRSLRGKPPFSMEK